MKEVDTSRFIRETLEYEGFDVHGPVAETGLYVDVEGEHPGPMVAYRAEMDALPIQDAKSVSYASQREGVAHLCGHDAHSSVAIGVALELRERRSELYGTVRVFFQPNEEGNPSGAPLMIRDGVLEGVHAAYCIHVDPHLPLGSVGVAFGAVTAAADSFLVTVEGPGTGHSARPHETVDTIWIVNQMLTSLYQLSGRIHDARNTAVITVGLVHGGTARNVIPREVSFGGTLRCVDANDRALLRDMMTETIDTIASLHGAKVNIDFMQGSPPVVNDFALAQNVETTAAKLFGPESVERIMRPSMGAEDFAHYLELVPGALVRVGSADGPDTRYPLHSARFDIAEDMLPVACHLMTQVLINDLENRMSGNGAG